jgi:peroxiredoxin
MVAVVSTMLELGTPAPELALPDTEGNTVSLAELPPAPALLVMFLSNHCPYVKHLRGAIADLARDYLPRGVQIVGIMSNDVSRYPADAPERMREERAAAGWTFPYLYDESQQVAHAYRAACTPDIFVFDGDRRLVYRGQFDSSRPGNPLRPNGEDVRFTLDALLGGWQVSGDQRPSIGCNIKWKPGNEPAWFG